MKQNIFKFLKDEDIFFTLTKDIVSDKKMWKVDIGIYCLVLYISGIKGKIEKIDCDIDI